MHGLERVKRKKTVEFYWESAKFIKAFSFVECKVNNNIWARHKTAVKGFGSR